ncbi:MAG TPA: hypothetical protein GXX39_09235 [Syntrophothermus lipocalidus]|uniref:Uncharacterized protein n=1 Tax=Syntrophothermus lipocalidus (strain DSM 12680 / TGB-C1) TaxID=643648 RepID=D7CIS9_SYNLT|nr:MULTISPECIES: hypothetical protein [Syntrophothermus]ADI02807.1 hypothetical protein Slip_2060 [Syntrophothermus lipocalidus DSM 12680]NSW82854.1 hypothetical protein [Syntrophothermus sp.]HHV77533.1 hypothetical protein [Syntrophothermus lipocalidus]
MSDRGLYDGAAVKKLWEEERYHDDFEIVDSEGEEEEVTVYDVDVVMGYSVDILQLGIYLFLGALVTGVIYTVFQYL